MKTAPIRPLETTWEDWVLGGGVCAAFADPELPLEVEIGPGDDDFLLENAEVHSEHNWLGIEYSRKRVRRYARRIQQRRGEPGNVRLIWRPAADVVTPFLRSGLVTRYHIYFPDPWPKKHHHRFRMLSATFLAALRDSLVPSGEIRLATDHLEYAEEIVAAFADAPGWRNLLPAPGYGVLAEGELGTVFEERWRTEGRAIHNLHLCREA